jgi:hypothetical protein
LKKALPKTQPATVLRALASGVMGDLVGSVGLKVYIAMLLISCKGDGEPVGRVLRRKGRGGWCKRPEEPLPLRRSWGDLASWELEGLQQQVSIGMGESRKNV